MLDGARRALDFFRSSKPGHIENQQLANKHVAHDETGGAFGKRAAGPVESVIVCNGPRMASIGRQARCIAGGASSVARRIAKPRWLACRAPSSEQNAGIRRLGNRR